MHLKFTCWSLVLYYLLTLALIDHQVYGANHIGSTHISSSQHHHHMDQSTLVFFTLNDLKLGQTLPIYFRMNNPSKSPKFLPKEEADLIPFSPSKLPYLLHFFNFTPHSSQATAMESTLRGCCEIRPIEGETKFCATSLESMLDFVHEILGKASKALNTQQKSEKWANVLHNYTIIDEPREIPAPKMVACHTMPYPYVIYYCHYQKSPSKVFQVLLRAQNNGRNGGGGGHDDDDHDDVIEAIAVCHMDTSQWSQTHVSFSILGIKPGTLPVCHFFPANDLVWLPLSDLGSEHMVSDM